MNDGAVTIVAYHYVRDVEGAAFPRIKGITPQAFEGQLDYITARYNVIDSATLVAAAKANDPGLLPPRAAYLTFDDGLSDHFATVFPALRRRRLHGAFFASAQPALHRVVTEVHKIQFILAASEDVEALARRVLRLAGPLRAEFPLEERHRISRPLLQARPLRPERERLRQAHAAERSSRAGITADRCRAIPGDGHARRSVFRRDALLQRRPTPRHGRRRNVCRRPWRHTPPARRPFRR